MHAMSPPCGVHELVPTVSGRPARVASLAGRGRVVFGLEATSRQNKAESNREVPMSVERRASHLPQGPANDPHSIVGSLISMSPRA